MGYDYLIDLLIVTLPVCTIGLICLKKYRRTIVEAGIAGCVVGSIWDYVSTNIQRIWSFNPDKILGIWIVGLPVEEWLFFLLVSMMTATVTLVLHGLKHNSFK